MRTEADYLVDENYKILYEDEWMLAVDKPAPLPVHPGGRFFTRNLLSLLKKERAGFLSIVNRLDSETSGLVIVAKSSHAAGRLGIEFQERRVLKEYQAVLCGRLAPSEGVLSQPLGIKQFQRFRLRVHDEAGESARTHYAVLGYGDNSGFAYTWVKARPETGRMHQLRAHFLLAGHPILGDKIYIDPHLFSRYLEHGWQADMLETVKTPRLMLHACRLSFRHPMINREIDFFSETPEALVPWLSAAQRT